MRGHGTGSSTASNVGCELGGWAGSLGGGEDGQVSSPEGVDTLGLQDSGGAVDDTGVWLVEPALLDHLILVLDKELHSLNGSSGGLGHTSGYTSEHEVLNKSELLFISHFDNLSWPCKESSE